MIAWRYLYKICMLYVLSAFSSFVISIPFEMVKALQFSKKIIMDLSIYFILLWILCVNSSTIYNLRCCSFFASLQLKAILCFCACCVVRFPFDLSFQQKTRYLSFVHFSVDINNNERRKNESNNNFQQLFKRLFEIKKKIYRRY